MILSLTETASRSERLTLWPRSKNSFVEIKCVERKNRLHRRLVLRKGLRKIVYTQAFVRHADPASWMLIQVSISAGMVKSLEWWWHLTRLITVYQTHLLHFSTTIQNWVSKSGFLSRCDLSDFQNLRQPVGLVDAERDLWSFWYNPPQRLVDGEVDGLEWTGWEPPQKSRLFGPFGLVLCWKFFFFELFFFFLVKNRCQLMVTCWFGARWFHFRGS